MAALSIRNLDEDTKRRLRVRAAGNGRSMEAEARAILREALADPGTSVGLVPTLARRFAEIGGVELNVPARRTPVRAPDLG